MPDQLIAAIPKNATEELQISLTEYKGYPLVAFRVFYADRDGAMRPGRGGFNIRPDAMPELRAAIDAAIDARRPTGEEGTQAQ